MGGDVWPYGFAKNRDEIAAMIRFARADGRFIIRNSWGTTWGDKGFAYASAAYLQAAFFDESYVMTV